jgi:hypothetical protein
MNGADVLKAACAAGVELALEDDVLVLEAAAKTFQMISIISTR